MAGPSRSARLRGASVSAEWLPPPRDAEYQELHRRCRRMGLFLGSAIYRREARWRGGDYWLTTVQGGSQLFQADKLQDIRNWLRMPSRGIA